MKIRLLRNTIIGFERTGNAGDTVEVDDDTGTTLLRMGKAEPATDTGGIKARVIADNPEPVSRVIPQRAPKSKV